MEWECSTKSWFTWAALRGNMSRDISRYLFWGPRKGSPRRDMGPLFISLDHGPLQERSLDFAVSLHFLKVLVVEFNCHTHNVVITVYKYMTSYFQEASFQLGAQGNCLVYLPGCDRLNTPSAHCTGTNAHGSALAWKASWLPIWQTYVERPWRSGPVVNNLN